MAQGQVFVGIDVGSAAVKVVALSLNDGAASVEGATGVPVIGGLDDSEEERLSQERLAVKRALDELGVRGSHLAVSLPMMATTVRKVRLPHSSAENMERMIRYEAERFIPLPVDEVELGYHLVEGLAQAHSETLIVAARKSVVAERAQLARDSGCRMPIATPGSVALFNALRDGLTADTTVAIVDLGSASTDLIVTREGEIELARTTLIGGHDLTQAFSEDLSVDLVEAEQAKRQEGVMLVRGVSDQPDLTTWQQASEQRPQVARWLGQLCQEIRHTLESYRGQATHGAVGELVLTGGAACTPGLAEALQTALSVKVRVIEGWEAYGVKGEAPEPGLYGTAVGLALQAGHAAAVSVNLVPREVEVRQRTRQRTQLAALLLGLLMISVGGLSWLGAAKVRAVEEELERTEARVERLSKETGGVAAAKAESKALAGIEDLAQKLDRPENRVLELLRLVSTVMPEDVWIEEFNYEQGRLLRLRGKALSSAAVKDAVLELARHEELGDVVLDDVTRDEIDGETVYSFVAACHFPSEKEANRR